MSWSMINYKNAWAHAHDWEQVLFMSLAPKFIDDSSKYSDIHWLSEWKLYWLDHKRNFVNGCSDMDLDSHLVSSEKVDEFIYFIDSYSLWLESFGTEIPKDCINKLIGLETMEYMKPCEVSYLLEFSEKLKAVINNDFHHDEVQLKDA